MNDITGFFDQPLQAAPADLHRVPKLDAWVELELSGRMVISGVISRHPKFPNGRRILTSTIEGYSSDDACRVYANTTNTKYELGERLEVLNQSHIVNVLTTAHKITPEHKQTRC